MNIEKLPSGSYRARLTYKGKSYRKTFDHKPTQKEIMQAIAAQLDDKPAAPKSQIAFEDAAHKYCEIKSNVLSPKTVREYIMLYKRLPGWFLSLPLSDIDQIALNKVVNELALDKAPKTVKNIHGFISAVLKTYRPELPVNTTLPQARRTEPYIPSVDEVKAMLQHLRGTEFEIPFILGCYGMRRSEICALTVDDLEGNVVHITKALVQDKDNKWVIKSTKTTQSTRDIIIPSETADKIRLQGYVYKGFPNSISRHMAKLEKDLGIEHFSMHKLRHYFASRMSALGIPEADILKMGGWNSDHVMKSVYRHSMIDKERNAKQEIADRLSQELFH